MVIWHLFLLFPQWCLPSPLGSGLIGHQETIMHRQFLSRDGEEFQAEHILRALLMDWALCGNHALLKSCTCLFPHLLVQANFNPWVCRGVCTRCEGSYPHCPNFNLLWNYQCVANFTSFKFRFSLPRFINDFQLDVDFEFFLNSLKSTFTCLSHLLIKGLLDIVATLAFGSRPRQGFARLQAKREAQDSNLMLPGMQNNVREWTLTLPSEPSFWELESRWIPKFSKGDFKGQNPLDGKVLYIIENLLKLICLKWACMTHLDIWNTSYGQKKGRESNWQFDFQPLKVKNRLDFLMCKWHATYCWKALDKGYNCFLDLISIRGLHTKL